MKLTLKSALTSPECFSLYEEDKYTFPMERYICVNQIKQSACTFIPLFENVDRVIFIKSLTQRKAVLVVERLKDTNYSLSSYSLKGERKTLKLVMQVLGAQIVTSECDLNTAHCALFFSEGVKLIQVDLTKMKIIAQGYLSEQINEIQASPIERDVISICGSGQLKMYNVSGEAYEQILDLLKKPEGKEFIAHIWFDSSILIACTMNDVYYYRDNDLLRIVSNPFASSIVGLSKLGKYFVLASLDGVAIYSRTNDDIHLYQISKITGDIEKMEVNYQQSTIVIKIKDFGLAFSHVDTNQQQNETQQSLLKWIYRPKIGKFAVDNVSVCENKSLALIVHRQEQSIQIWNLDTGICILKKQFLRSEDNANMGLITGSIHPNGYSIALAFGDRIRLYHLTVEDITLFDEISCRRLKYLKFSNGGHLLAYISGRSKNSAVGIINVFTGQETNAKINTDLEHLTWSFGDEQLAAAGETNIYIWKVGANFKQREDIYLTQKVNSICFDYKSAKLLASVSGELLQIESAGKVNKIQIEIPKFYTLISNPNKYVATDHLGAIYIDNDLNFSKAERIVVSSGKAKMLNYLNNILYLHETKNEFFVLKSREESKIRHEDYTLITRTQITKNREKLKTLQQLIETYQTELMSRLEHERVKFKEVKSVDEKQFNQQALRLQQQFSELTTEKLHIEKVSGHLFKTVEEKQLKAVETLEVLYQQKLALERRKIMDLEQKILEQNVNFQKTIQTMKNNYRKQVIDLKRELADKSNTGVMQSRIKQREEQLNVEHEMRLHELEEENQTYADEIQSKANISISDLYSQINLLKRKYNSSQVQNQTMRLEMEQLRSQLQIKEEDLTNTKSKIQENKNRVASLEKQVLWKNDLIKDKENKLYEFEYKIADLEKSKEVMSFRTTEIWRELEPKESEVDRLKKKLAKLQSQFKEAEKQSKNTLEKLIKRDNLIIHLKKAASDIKIELKLKTNEYEQLALQMHRLVNDVEPRSRGTEILKVYQQYVKFKKPQKDLQPENQKIQELNRHVIHAEQSLYQMNISKKKEIKSKEQQSLWKMKENAELISDINDLRKKVKQYSSEMSIKDTQIARLKREVIQTSSKRAISEYTGLGLGSSVQGASSRKRNIKSSQVPLRQVDSMQTSFRMDHKHQYSTMRTRQTRIMSANKTAIVHRAMNDSNAERTQISEYAQELEIANRRIQQQDRIIDELNRRLMNQSNQS